MGCGGVGWGGVGGQICVDVGVVRCHFCSVVRCPTRCLALAQLESGPGSGSGSGLTGAAASAAGGSASASATGAAASASALALDLGGAAATYGGASTYAASAAWTADAGADELDDEEYAPHVCGRHMGHSIATVPFGLLAGRSSGGRIGGCIGRAFGGISAAAMSA